MASERAVFGTKHVAKGVGRATDLVMVRGAGSYVTMDNDKTYLDFTCGIGVTNLGHCHPHVTKAAQKQCETLVHGQVNIAFHDKYLGLIEKLLPVMPDKSLDTFFFWCVRWHSAISRRETDSSVRANSGTLALRRSRRPSS